MPRTEVELMDLSAQNLSDSAPQISPDKLIGKKADPGVYSDTGHFGLGAGWYHFGTSENQLFVGHPDEADFFVLDFDVMASGKADKQGKDAITHFERGTDDVVFLNTFAEIAPGVSYSTVAEGTGPRGRFDDGIEFSLVRLEFVGGIPIQTHLTDLGDLRFVDLV